MAEIEEEQDYDVITLVDENDKDVDFYNDGVFDYDNRSFIVLSPVEPMEGIADDEVLIYELFDDEGDDFRLVPIEDREYLDKVFEEYIRLVEEAEEECGCGCGEHDCDCGEHECHHGEHECHKGDDECKHHDHECHKGDKGCKKNKCNK